jgi:ornithine carbamoyltransferase
MVIRTYDHEDIIEYAKHSRIPVINGLTDYCHPCQIISDIFTIKENLGKVGGVRVAFIGDGANNVATSWIFGTAKMGMKLSIAAPNKYWPKPEIIREAVKISVYGKDFFEITTDIDQAVTGADVIYTDVFVSMGHDAETERRRRDLMPYQVNQEVVEKVGKKVLVMHCLPAHRGEEISDEVIDGPYSIVFDQAENRLHVQKAILALLIDRKDDAGEDK